MTATHALGWALVHSLWQCALAAVALALLLAIVPARSARIRYALATATLVLTLALPLTTAVRVGEASPATPGNGLATSAVASRPRSEEHTSELQSPYDLVCRLLLEKKKQMNNLSSSVTRH